jgi:two-component system, NarL family, invasion response regulator UvrY
MTPTVEPDAVTVMVVDDWSSFRRAVAALVETMVGFRLVGEAASGEEAIEMATAITPELVLMDVNMPGMGGVAAADVLRATDAKMCIVLVSTYDAADLPVDVQKADYRYVNKERLTASTLRSLAAEHNG